jgi:hypothetical protein
MNLSHIHIMDNINMLDIPCEEKLNRLYKYYDWPLSYEETKQYLIHNS